MHTYYAQNQKKFQNALNGYLSLIAPELEDDTGKPYPQLLEEIQACYRDKMLEYFPYIGGDSASGTRNLTGAFAFVAMGEVCCKAYGMSLEHWGYLTTLCYQRYFEKIPLFLRKLVGRLMRHPSMITKMLRKKDAKNAENAAKNPGSFETQVQTPTGEYAVQYNTTVCPLANFAAENGFTAYMPYLCNLDYVMFAACNVPFYREHTCADGDGYCDFKLKTGAPVNSSWPCHSLTPGDPLK